LEDPASSVYLPGGDINPLKLLHNSELREELCFGIIEVGKLCAKPPPTAEAEEASAAAFTRPKYIPSYL